MLSCEEAQTRAPCEPAEGQNPPRAPVCSARPLLHFAHPQCRGQAHSREFGGRLCSHWRRRRQPQLRRCRRRHWQTHVGPGPRLQPPPQCLAAPRRSPQRCSHGIDSSAPRARGPAEQRNHCGPGARSTRNGRGTASHGHRSTARLRGTACRRTRTTPLGQRRRPLYGGGSPTSRFFSPVTAERPSWLRFLFNNWTAVVKSVQRAASSSRREGASAIAILQYCIAILPILQYCNS